MIVAKVESWNKRIIVANFNGSPAHTIIAHYYPNEGSNKAENHYKLLAVAVKGLPKHNMLVVMGYFKAHLGIDALKYSFHESSNNNG